MQAENERLAADRDRLAGERAALKSEVDRLSAQNERFEQIIKALQRARFGRSSERINDEQMNLALDDVECEFAAADATAEKANEIVRGKGVKGRRANRGNLPGRLPREEIVIEPEDKN